MIVNQYSFAIVAVVLLGGATLWAYYGAWELGRVLVVVGLVIATAVVAFTSQRTASEGAMPDILGEGKVVLVEYYSDY